MTTATAAEEIRVGEYVIRFLVEAEATAGTAALFEFDVPAGSPVPPAHSHDAFEETIYGLRGTLTWTVDGATTALGPGEVLCIARGTVHRFENVGTEAATQLAVVTPDCSARRTSATWPPSSTSTARPTLQPPST